MTGKASGFCNAENDCLICILKKYFHQRDSIIIYLISKSGLSLDRLRHFFSRAYGWLQQASEKEIKYFKVCELSGIPAVDEWWMDTDGYCPKTTLYVFCTNYVKKNYKEKWKRKSLKVHEKHGSENK